MLKNCWPALVLATLFVLAIYGVSLSSQHQPHHQTINCSDQNAHQPVRPESADEKIAFYTEVLAVFTGILALVSSVQICFLYLADKTARIAANAAKLSADAAVNVELPKLLISKIKLQDPKIADLCSQGHRDGNYIVD